MPSRICPSMVASTMLDRPGRAVGLGVYCLSCQGRIAGAPGIIIAAAFLAGWRPKCRPASPKLNECKSIVICVLRVNNTVNALGKSGNSCRLAANTIVATFCRHRWVSPVRRADRTPPLEPNESVGSVGFGFSFESCFRYPGLKQLGELLGRNGPTEIVALRLVTLVGLKEYQLLLRFDALSYHSQL